MRKVWSEAITKRKNCNSEISAVALQIENKSNNESTYDRQSEHKNQGNQYS